MPRCVEGREPLTELQFASSAPRLICVKAIIALGFIIHAQGRAALAEHQHLLLNKPGVCTCICSTWTNSKHVHACVSEIVNRSRIKFTIFTVEYFIIFSLLLCFIPFSHLSFWSLWFLFFLLWFFVGSSTSSYFNINMSITCSHRPGPNHFGVLGRILGVDPLHCSKFLY